MLGQPEPPRPSKLTPEQLARIEQNRQAALKRKAEKLGQLPSREGPATLPSSSFYGAPPKPVAQRPISSTAVQMMQQQATWLQQSKKEDPYGTTHQPPPPPAATREETPCKMTTTLLDTQFFALSPCTAALQSQLPHYATCFTLLFLTAEYRVTHALMSDVKGDSWVFSITQYMSVVRDIKDRLSSVVWDEVPMTVLRAMSQRFHQSATVKAQHEANVDALLSCVQQTLKLPLLPFQEEGVRYPLLILMNLRRGLGKTAQAIVTALIYRTEWPLLVLCPASLKENWAEAFLKFSAELREEDIYVLRKGKDWPNASGHLIRIVSFDMAARIADAIKQTHFQVVICDESHHLKNAQTKKADMMLPVLTSARRAILLSGTPALSRPKELHSQIKMVAPTLMPNFFEYGKRYCGGHQQGGYWHFEGASHLDELQLVLEELVIIRRLKTDVLTTLPRKTRTLAFIEVTSAALKLQNQRRMIKVGQKLLADATASMSGEQLAFDKNYLAAWRDASIVKQVACLDYLCHVVKEREKVIIFAHHREFLDTIQKAIGEAGWHAMRIDGSTPSHQRQALCHDFQKKAWCRVALLSITAAGVGLTLTAANLVLFAELFWNPGVHFHALSMLLQAEDRCHRIGQTRPVEVRYLLAKGTFDDFMWPLLQRKLGVLSQAGLSAENSLSHQDALPPADAIAEAEIQDDDDEAEEMEKQDEKDDAESVPSSEESDDDLVDRFTGLVASPMKEADVDESMEDIILD